MTKEVQHCCHTCQKMFNDGDELRSHVQYFQYEIQQLLARLIEFQAHLPPLNADSSADNSDEYDGNDLDAVHGIYRCPERKCLRTKSFKEKQGLEIHYQQHVKCLEICACGGIFTNVRAFIRHQCKSDPGHARAGRIKKLRDITREKMDVPLKKQQDLAARHSGTSKRALLDTKPLPNSSPKRRQVSAPHTLDQANGSDEAVYLHDLPTLPSSIPGRAGGTTVSNPFPAPHASIAAPSFAPESMTASIVWDHTIPPFHITHPPDASFLPSNTPFSGDNEAHQLDTSSCYPLPDRGDLADLDMGRHRKQ